MSEPNLNDERNFKKLSFELSACGLSINQSKIYLFLLGNGTSPVREISRSLSLHRVDVYRKLHELQDLGLLETQLGTPKKYAAVEPGLALSAIMRRQTRELDNVKQLSTALAPLLRKYRNSFQLRKDLNHSSTSLDSSYSLVMGRERYYGEIKRLVKNANYEVLRIVSAGGVIRTFKSGLFETYVRAKARGIRLRMITEINKRNLPFAKRLSEVVELRHLDEVHLRFTVVDDSVSVLSARFDEHLLSVHSVSDSYLLLKDPKFTEAFRFFFEHLWRVAKPDY